ncbi:hypothetical protein MKK63_23320 [Methylobacterium sp. J-088]|uniref:hypothetical protein n=1 Tax=unclassified Methylobacterium TaxID=2615210 RepID=UPI001FB9E49A|nr:MULTISPECIES: hypothetical protein [unclassified Methylobacterium]MCJ2065617.1 hypothetical protein [Methylobacterium sp. J-088]
MMRPAAITACLTLFLTAPALASPCGDRIEGVSKRVQAELTQSISASTSGQGNAAKRGGEGVTGTEGQRANESPEAPPEKSAQAGQGADAAQQAKVALEEARTADSKGDAAGCDAAVSRAEQQLKKAP